MKIHNRDKDKCKKGHPYDRENTYRAFGKRYCRTCRKLWMRRYDAAKRKKKG